MSWRVVPQQDLCPSPSSTPRSLRESCDSPIPTNQFIAGELASARRAGLDSKLRTPVVAPSPTPPPLIVGRVAKRKAGSKKTYSKSVSGDGEEIADFFGQLWVIPSPSRRQRLHKERQEPPNPKYAIPRLFWVRKDLFLARKFTVHDCFPVSFLGRFDPVPTIFKISTEGLGFPRSFVEAVKEGMENRGAAVQRQRRPPPGRKAVPQDVKATAPVTGVVAKPAHQGAPKLANQGNLQAKAAVPVTTDPPPTPLPAMQVLDPKYKDMICFNCSWPGHYVGNCVEPKKMLYLCWRP